MEIRGVIGEACATAIGIVLAAFIVSYATNLGKVIPALGELPLWVAIVALLSIGGRVLGALAGVSGAMRASIVSPEAVGYAGGAVRVVHEEFGSRIGHLLEMALSMIISHVLRYVALLVLSH